MMAVMFTNGHGNPQAGIEITSVASSTLPTAYGEFQVTVYQDDSGQETLLIAMGDIQGTPPLVRLHSECLTGDVFGSRRCDCGEQLQLALARIAAVGRGLLIYLRQEGRGIGLTNKIRAYALQDTGMDTVEANLHLGFPADARSYETAVAILRDQQVHAVRLMTNNPQKITGLTKFGIEVAERIAHQQPAYKENQAYLRTKAQKMGHQLDDRLITP